MEADGKMEWNDFWCRKCECVLEDGVAMRRVYPSGNLRGQCINLNALPVVLAPVKKCSGCGYSKSHERLRAK